MAVSAPHDAGILFHLGIDMEFDLNVLMTWTTLALTNSDQEYNDRNGTDDLDDKMTINQIDSCFSVVIETRR
jgi:hypothetical protein